MPDRSNRIYRGNLVGMGLYRAVPRGNQRFQWPTFLQVTRTAHLNDRRARSNRTRIILVSKRDMRDQDFGDQIGPEIFIMRRGDFRHDDPDGNGGREYLAYDLYDDVVNRDDGFNNSKLNVRTDTRKEDILDNEDGELLSKIKNQVDEPDDLPGLLCVRTRENKSAIFYECSEADEEHFLCVDTAGFMGPCRTFPNRTTLFVPLCVLKNAVNYVVSCYAPGNEKFCFGSSLHSLFPCSDESKRACFNENKDFNFCKMLSAGRKRPRQRRSPAVVHLTKKNPYKVVNCKDCEVNVKMVVDENDGDDAPPKVDVRVRKLDHGFDIEDES